MDLGNMVNADEQRYHLPKGSKSSNRSRTWEQVLKTIKAVLFSQKSVVRVVVELSQSAKQREIKTELCTMNYLGHWHVLWYTGFKEPEGGQADGQTSCFISAPAGMWDKP